MPYLILPLADGTLPTARALRDMGFHISNAVADRDHAEQGPGDEPGQREGPGPRQRTPSRIGDCKVKPDCGP